MLCDYGYMVQTMSEPVSVARMTAHYQGDALRNHEIDVRQLGPALVGLSLSFERAQALVDPGYRIKLNAKATSERSVVIDLILRITNDVVPFLSSDEASAAANAIEIGAFVFGGIRLTSNAILHHGKPKKVEDTKGDDSKIDVKYPDGTIERTYPESLEMIGDPGFVKGVKDATAPALCDGIDRIEFHLSDVSETVTQEDAEAIDSYDVSDSDTTVSEMEMVVQALQPSFQEDGKWRITDGIKKQYVSIDDAAFKKRVLDSIESLRANDTYKVIMKVEKKFDSKNQLSTRYIAIEKVIDHKHMEEQGALF